MNTHTHYDDNLTALEAHRTTIVVALIAVLIGCLTWDIVQGLATLITGAL